MPGYLAEHGVGEINTFIADKPATLVPPYASEAQQALRDYVLREAEQGTVGWMREDARRFFIAGGGSPAEVADRVVAFAERDLPALARQQEPGLVEDFVDRGRRGGARGDERRGTVVGLRGKDRTARLTTRSISPITAEGESTWISTVWQVTRSKLASGNGSASARPST